MSGRFNFHLNMRSALSKGVLVLACLAPALPVWADDSPYVVGQRQYPNNAEKGKIRFTNPPEVKINGTTMRLAGSTRIRDENNRPLTLGQLQQKPYYKKSFRIMYTANESGHIRRIWILSRDERSRTSPSDERRRMLRQQGAADGYITHKQKKINPLTPFNELPRYPN